MIITCAIIDDEPLAAGLLESYVEKTEYLELHGTYNSAIKAMKDLRDNPVQLLFLDIQMPELSGVEFAKILRKDTRIIFTTAFPQYAIDSYKLNALDYLLKPISYDDFLKSSDKALEWFTLVTKQNALRRDRFVFVKSDYKLHRISLDNIVYVEGFKDYVRFFMKNGDQVMSLMSMKKLDEYLPKPEFLRIHRSFIVHMTKIQCVDRFRLVFDDMMIPISENYQEDVVAYFEEHTL